MFSRSSVGVLVNMTGRKTAVLGAQPFVILQQPTGRVSSLVCLGLKYEGMTSGGFMLVSSSGRCYNLVSGSDLHR